MKIYLFILVLGVCQVLPLSGQNLEKRLTALQEQLRELKEREAIILAEIEDVKLAQLRAGLNQWGLPAARAGDSIVHHRILSLVYDETHEQARWVAHVISPEIRTGRVFRTDDFRPDPAVSTGTAVEEDYFLKYLQPDSSYEYDGYGYDRGHLAPSADFRWSQRALSESYYYSNITPQLPEFNREIWAQLEGQLRNYLYENPDSKLYVVTGPALREGLAKVERSTNEVSIPDAFWKVALDPVRQKSIGFWIPHRAAAYPLEHYALPVDEIEAKTGIDFYAAFEDEVEAQLESRLNKKDWFPSLKAGDREPLYAPSLPRNHFNTVQAKKYINKQDEINVCGTVVSARLSRKGNLLANLDKQFPNQIFTLFVRKEHLVNFSYNPVEYLMNQQICVTGEVLSMGGTPAIFAEREEEIQLYEEGAGER